MSNTPFTDPRTGAATPTPSAAPGYDRHRLGVRSLGARLEELEADMERSSHGKTTHLLRARVGQTDSLDGPPRPDREEWERLTELWLAAALAAAGGEDAR